MPRDDPTDPIDENLLAAYVEGRLEPERRTLVEARLARDDEARRWVAAVAADADEAAAEGRVASMPRARRIPWRWPAMAAALALAVGTAVLRPWRRDPPAAAERLVASAEALARAEPALFAGFRPLDEAELSGGGEPALRGGIVVVRPRGVLLDGRPEVAWTTVGGAAAYRVSLLRDDGTALWTRDARASPLAYPADAEALAPGTRALAEVTAEGGLGRAEGRVAFSVATGVEADAVRRALSAIDAEPDPALRSLLRAHFALRRGLLLEAERTARTHVTSFPEDPAGPVLVAHVERRLGLRPPEARPR